MIDKIGKIKSCEQVPIKKLGTVKVRAMYGASGFSFFFLYFICTLSIPTKSFLLIITISGYYLAAYLS